MLRIVKRKNLGFWWLCWATKAPFSLPSGFFFLYQRENFMCLVWVSVTNSPSQFLTLYSKLIFYFLPHKFTSFQIFPVSMKQFLCSSWNMSSVSLLLGLWIFVHSWLRLSSPKIPFGSHLIFVQMPTYQQSLPRAFFLKLHFFLHYTFPYPEFIFLSTYKYLIYNYLFICWFSVSLLIEM